MRKVQTKRRVKVDIGEIGAIPSPIVRIILRRYPKGIYMSPNLLSVF
jgi:hypothetical protein